MIGRPLSIHLSRRSARQIGERKTRKVCGEINRRSLKVGDGFRSSHAVAQCAIELTSIGWPDGTSRRLSAASLPTVLRDSLSNVQAGTKRCSQPSQNIAPKRRIECSAPTAHMPIPHPRFYETGASPVGLAPVLLRGICKLATSALLVSPPRQACIHYEFETGFLATTTRFLPTTPDSTRSSCRLIGNT